jgi:hypothetical protein
MITLSEDALAYVEEKNTSLFIDVPYKVSGCCFDMTDCPAVNFGEPRQVAEYTKQTISGVTVFVPNSFPSDNPVVIRTRSFLGFRQLVLDGWRLM